MIFVMSSHLPRLRTSIKLRTSALNKDYKNDPVQGDNGSAFHSPPVSPWRSFWTEGLPKQRGYVWRQGENKRESSNQHPPSRISHLKDRKEKPLSVISLRGHLQPCALVHSYTTHSILTTTNWDINSTVVLFYRWKYCYIYTLLGRQRTGLNQSS